MRYLLLLLFHLGSILLALAPLGYFGFALIYGSNYVDLENVPQAFVVWFLAIPTAIGIVSGMLIDSLSVFMRGEKFYAKGDWSRTRRRSLLFAVIAGGILYLDYAIFAS